MFARTQIRTHALPSINIRLIMQAIEREKEFPEDVYNARVVIL